MVGLHYIENIDWLKYEFTHLKSVEWIVIFDRECSVISDREDVAIMTE
jgi:hypothetical protein